MSTLAGKPGIAYCPDSWPLIAETHHDKQAKFGRVTQLETKFI